MFKSRYSGTEAEKDGGMLTQLKEGDEKGFGVCSIWVCGVGRWVDGVFLMGGCLGFWGVVGCWGGFFFWEFQYLTPRDSPV